MNASELVERLRARCSYGDARRWQKHDPLSERAADLIEAQARAIEEMRAKIAHLDVNNQKMHARAQKAEALAASSKRRGQ